ncbi:MAG: hypothetical protein JO108_34300 [Acidobacteriaceae bacterium]|nr:hypothetical protein [Acidobacteriaceae bacterium]
MLIAEPHGVQAEKAEQPPKQLRIVQPQVRWTVHTPQAEITVQPQLG